ncbi:unnamed protein product [Rhizoctonia solani]|uniref:Inner centromere protein ARK-binding domain-containing protein n=1 Tax=Rhizoctonia solani TaxID=456999 RepID=A0A8H3E5Z6_9AGAM|nr:unnamed protein product [Rhizoctonia solani]
MSIGFAQWASGIRNRMARDPGRADFKDQVQCNGYLFLHEYLDDVLNAPRPDNILEFTKTPGRNKTASKKARALHASAQKLKPVAPIVFPPGPQDKENDASPKQPFKPVSRSQPAHPESIAEASGPRDSIARATPVRSGVPIFSPANRSVGPLPTPSEDPLSPFRDTTTTIGVTAQQIFTTKLVVEPSSPAPEKDLPMPPVDEAKPSEPEQDLSIIQEDDEGQSVAGFEDAREEFTDARSMTTLEGDITEIAEQIPSEPQAQRLPSPPASEDNPTTASEPPTPVREPEHEPTEPITSTNIIADALDDAPVTAPTPEPTKKSLPTTTTQPTPPPEPTAIQTITSPRPLPIPPSRGNSGSGTQQPLKPPLFAQPIPPTSNPPRASSAVPRGPFTGPSLKDLRREPSVSGNANQLRQSSWRKKPDGVTATTSIGSATDSEASRLKRKSDAVQLPPRPPPSKSQKLSRGSSPSGSSSDEETEMQVPLKDEDGGSGTWNAGPSSMLDDLRSRLARLEKSTSGKTPATSRIWTPTMPTTSLPATGSETRLSLSDLSVRPASESSAEKAKEMEPEPEVVPLDLGLSTDDPTSSMLSNRSTTPVDSPPPARRVLPAPPVFALPNTANAVRAAKAEAARLFGGTKFTAPPARTETQTTVMTDVSSVFDKARQSQSQFTQSTAVTQLESQDVEMEDELDADLDLDLDPDVDVDGDDDMDADGEEDDAKTTSSRNSTKSTAKKGPVKSTQLPTAKKPADDKASRLREMEERRQAAALRKAEEEKSRALESEKKRKEREELAAKGVKAPVKKVTEDPNKKRKLEAETKAAGKKPAVPATLAQSTVTAPTASSSTKSRIAKPTATPGPSTLKSAMKSTTNPFQPTPSTSTAKTLKPSASSSSLKSVAAKKAKGSISDAPGQALQQQMQARVQAQLKAAQKEPEIQSENIELPDIHSEYSDSEDEDRGKDFPSWTQDQALMDALKSQESFNPDALFGPIQPLKMGDLFKTGHSRFRKRTSSANWAGTDGITLEEEIEYARKMGYTNK